MSNKDETTSKAYEIATAVSEAIWGGEHGWEKGDHNDLTGFKAFKL